MRGKVLGLVALGVLAAGCGGGGAGVAAATAAPAACIHALDTVGQLRALAAKGVDAHMRANRRVGVAYEAGLQRDSAAVDRLIADIRADTAEQQRDNQRLGRLMTDFETAEAACRQAGSAR